MRIKSKRQTKHYRNGFMVSVWGRNISFCCFYVIMWNEIWRKLIERNPLSQFGKKVLVLRYIFIVSHEEGQIRLIFKWQPDWYYIYIRAYFHVMKNIHAHKLYLVVYRNNINYCCPFHCFLLLGICIGFLISLKLCVFCPSIYLER